MSVRWYGGLRFVAAALIATLWCGPAAADPSSLVEGTHDVRDADARSRLARNIAHELTGALRRIGAPAPHEAASVTEEYRAIERLRDPNAVNARAQRLFASASFQQLRLVNTLTVVRDSLHCAASSYGSLRREMACWAIAAAYLSDRGLYEDALDVLLRNGRLGYGDGMTRSRWLAQPALWSRYGLAIQDLITIPFLRGGAD